MVVRRKAPEGNVRRVRSTGENYIGDVHSKTGRDVQCESYAERCWLYRLDRNRKVKDYSSQPERFERDGYTYVPDFIVWWHDGRVEIHEVTRAHRRTREDIRRRERIGREVCAERGWGFFVYTEDDLPVGAELANLSLLIRYRPRAYANPEVTREGLARLVSERTIQFGPLVWHVANRLGLETPDVVSALCHLIWHGDLNIDLSKLFFADGAPIPTTPVTLGNGEEM